MSNEFASSGLTAGQLNAIVKKLGGHDMALCFLRGEISVSKPTRSWREEEGVIYFSVTSDGTTGEDWIKRLSGKGFHVADYAKEVLCSPNFKPTSGVTTEVAVFKGTIFEDSHRITKNILAEADEYRFEKPNAELACLFSEKFTDEEIGQMGLMWIVVMHEPINDSAGEPFILSVDCLDDGSLLFVCCDNFDESWDPGRGFAFAVSQVSSES